MSLPITGSGFAPASAVDLELHSTPTSLGSVLVGSDGTFSTAVTIPASTEGGTHHVVGKGTGADGGVAAPEAALVVDSAAPRLEESVSTAGSSQTITLTARITDDLAGNAGAGYYSSPSQVRFVSPSGHQAVTAMLNRTRLVSGTPQDGTYETTLTVPQYAEQGTWTVQYFLLVDQVGNSRTLTPADMVAAGLPTSFENG